MFHAHIFLPHTQPISYAIDFIYPLLTTVQIAKICFIHFLNLTHRAETDVIFILSKYTPTLRTPRSPKKKHKNYGQIANARFNGCFIFFPLSVVFIYAQKDRVCVCLRLYVPSFALLSAQ